ncbi:hypothetical protein VNI00_010304 [Paramarasmius palmivorus]|uniref:Uncharacterized protein n=1 Tax=Paramarasmius palmivorus TaxID=297713 RepID=A0AAW0CJM2_9AGAR
MVKQPTTLQVAPVDIPALEVIHYYTACSSSSFCSNANFADTCKIAIPTLSFTNPFLRHAMFSCTALHLGHLYSWNEFKKTEWLDRASLHRKISFSLLHQTVKPPTPIVDSESDTKYIGICFLALYTISSGLKASPSKIFSILTFIHNCWSGNQINTFMYADRRLGPMQPITPSRSGAQTPMMEHLMLICIPDDTSIPDRWELEIPEIAEAYKSAVDVLLHTFYPLSQTGFQIMSAIQWPALFPKRFCDLLNERKQRALVLLYHYLVTLRHIGDNGYWWACDMGRCADYVYSLLNFEWQMWLGRGLGWLHNGGYVEYESLGVVV